MTYRILDEFSHNGEGWEVRKYNPQRRTVWIGGRDYFLQFPWIVFMRLFHKDRSYLSIAFAKEDDSLVYAPMLPHCATDNIYNLWIVCLGGGYDDGSTSEFQHYCHSSKISFDDMIARFWTSHFTTFDYWYVNRDTIRKAFGELNPIHKWQKSNLDQVLDVLQDPIKLGDYILATVSVITNSNAQR